MDYGLRTFTLLQFAVCPLRFTFTFVHCSTVVTLPHVTHVYAHWWTLLLLRLHFHTPVLLINLPRYVPVPFADWLLLRLRTLLRLVTLLVRFTVVLVLPFVYLPFALPVCTILVCAFTLFTTFARLWIPDCRLRVYVCYIRLLPFVCRSVDFVPVTTRLGVPRFTLRCDSTHATYVFVYVYVVRCYPLRCLCVTHFTRLLTRYAFGRYVCPRAFCYLHAFDSRCSVATSTPLHVPRSCRWLRLRSHVTLFTLWLILYVTTRSWFVCLLPVRLDLPHVYAFVTHVRYTFDLRCCVAVVLLIVCYVYIVRVTTQLLRYVHGAHVYVPFTVCVHVPVYGCLLPDSLVYVCVSLPRSPHRYTAVAHSWFWFWLLFTFAVDSAIIQLRTIHGLPLFAFDYVRSYTVCLRLPRLITDYTHVCWLRSLLRYWLRWFLPFDFTPRYLVRSFTRCTRTRSAVLRWVSRVPDSRFATPHHTLPVAFPDYRLRRYTFTPHTDYGCVWLRSAGWFYGLVTVTTLHFVDSAVVAFAVTFAFYALRFTTVHYAFTLRLPYAVTFAVALVPAFGYAGYCRTFTFVAFGCYALHAFVTGWFTARVCVYGCWFGYRFCSYAFTVVTRLLRCLAVAHVGFYVLRLYVWFVTCVG